MEEHTHLHLPMGRGGEKMIEYFENLLTIELGEYGFMFNSAWLFVEVSWELLLLAVLVIVGRKAWKVWRNR